MDDKHGHVYFDKNEEELYFGRDLFGRKSLLLGKKGDLIVLSSVSRKIHDCTFIELPSIGIFCWNLRTDLLSIGAFQYDSPNFQSKLEELETFLDKKIVVKNRENITKILEFQEPTSQCISLYKTLEDVKTGNNFSVLLKNKDWLNKVTQLKTLLEKSIQTRISNLPNYCKDCIKDKLICQHPLVGVLFSGGVDCSILALLADQFIDKSRPIDLFNVAFDETKNYQTPDRQTGLQTLEELRRLCPLREWRFFEINIPRKELDEARQFHIADLIHPLKSVLDDSLGCALWFAGRGMTGGEKSPCRVLLVGMGADELFGGYTKHRAAFKKQLWLGLHEILKEDWQSLPYRNLARDDRVVSDHGRQLRMPYLDESLVEFVLSLQCWERSYPSDKVAQGFGEKILLRSLAHHIGLTEAALLRKRALQFGSRIANKKENAHETSIKLC
nr:asparagine synthetase domain-containing protein CG17486 [Leptinotarsa decemlineata]